MEKNFPTLHQKFGVGDSSIVRLAGNEAANTSSEGQDEVKKYNIKRTELTILLHEYYHAWRMAKGLIKTREEEEVKAVQFVNKNFRSSTNRRPKYDTLDVPLEKK